MFSDDELFDQDVSDNIFVRNTPQEDSPGVSSGTFSCYLINHLGLSSMEGIETAINNTQYLYA